MHNKKVFTGCMIRHGALLLAEAILALAVSVILVQGNKIISGVIDEMLSGRQVLFGSFLLQFDLHGGGNHSGFLAECGSQPVCGGSLYGV